MKNKNTYKKYYKITGMTCRNCEKDIERRINRLPGLKHCKADYVKGILTIGFEDRSVSSDQISVLIQEAGYTGREISWLKKLFHEIFPLLLAGIIILAVSITAERTGILNQIPEIRKEMSYPLLFIIGLLTSLHCIGMCGGISLSQSGSDLCETNGFPAVKRSLAYNAGRILSYSVLGGIVGGIGSVLYLSAAAQVFIIVAAGIIMTIMGLNMIGILSVLKFLIPLLPESFSDKIRRLPKKNPFVIGILNGLMPCGPLQSMQIYALSTGSFFYGALSMFLFSIGTVPLMLAFGSLSIFFNKKFRKNVTRISALLIIVLGWGMISRGLNLGGVTILPRDSEQIAVNAAVARIEGETQIVNSHIYPSAYEPIIVQQDLPVKWILEAGSGDITGCNNAIVSRDFKIRQNLKEGETVVEFTPEEPGNYRFTCWMGMITSNILVVEDLTSFDPDLLQAPTGTSSERVELQIPDFQIGDIGYSTVTVDNQTISLQIDENGFTPSIIVVEKNIQTAWEFKTGTIDEKTERLLFPTYNAQMELAENDSQKVEILPAGDFYFYSWQGDYMGFVIVVEDIENISDLEILETVSSYLKK